MKELDLELVTPVPLVEDLETDERPDLAELADLTARVGRFAATLSEVVKAVKK